MTILILWRDIAQALIFLKPFLLGEGDTRDSHLKCYSQILYGGSADIFKFWLFCIDLVAN